MAYQSSLTEDEIDRLFSSSNTMDLVIASRKAHQFGDRYATKLVDLLDHEFYEIRAYAAKSLGKIGYEQAINKLIPLLDDEVEEVRFSTAEALGNFQSSIIITPLLKSLADHSRETRRMATSSLNNQESEVLFESIQEWLDGIQPTDYDMEDEDAIIRIDVSRGIMEACSDFDYNWTNEILEQGMDSQDLEMNRMAVISIGNCKLQEFVNPLVELHNHDDDDFRLAVIYALTRLDFKDKASVLFDHVADSYEFIRETLAEYIPQTYFNDEGKQMINMYMDDPVPFVRSALAKGLQSPVYLDKLKLLIQDENPFVRKAAIQSLSSIGGTEALEVLESHDEEDDLIEIALENGIEDIKQGLSKPLNQ